MTTLVAGGAIVVVGLLLLWRLRTRTGRPWLVEPPHTPPTVPWRSGGQPQAPQPPQPGDEG